MRSMSSGSRLLLLLSVLALVVGVTSAANAAQATPTELSLAADRVHAGDDDDAADRRSPARAAHRSRAPRSRSSAAPTTPGRRYRS